MDAISAQFCILFLLVVSPILAIGYSFLHMSLLSDIQYFSCQCCQGRINCIRQNCYFFLTCSTFSDLYGEGEAEQLYPAEGAKVLLALFHVHPQGDESITIAAVIIFTESSRADHGQLAFVLLQQQKSDAGICQVNVTQETYRASAFLLAVLELFVRKAQRYPTDIRTGKLLYGCRE